ncbi:hypothetical protein ATO6_15640 [Oceanicola sp. 22II-s10i]|uniref:calcium-binding protein n=1 Tax=Oceanicola sp. 22II-s10i TaxID=1317116 RepID=UPI000B52178B|nr:calcium-binding protein [Oceanicola sp. 22II-s10i]OWU83854.1 hypothetical protein ATO6_15640 [Oceanicola sp. 22II-s10i]
MGQVFLLGGTMIIAFLALIGLSAFIFIGNDSGGDDDTEVAEKVEGTEDNDILVGTSGIDLLTGLGGDDVLLGLEGDDQLDGNAGGDAILGGKGDDLLQGVTGDDVLVGGRGEDTLDGGAGDDLLVGSDGIRDIDLANDIIAAQQTQDVSDLLDSDKYVVATRDFGEADLLLGGAGEDALILGANDTGTSGEGEDLVIVGDWMNTDAGHAVVTDLRDATTSGDILMFEYDASGPAPILSLEHDDAEGVSNLFADGRLILQVQNAPGAARLQLSEIAMAGY